MKIFFTNFLPVSPASAVGEVGGDVEDMGKGRGGGIHVLFIVYYTSNFRIFCPFKMLII